MASERISKNKTYRNGKHSPSIVESKAVNVEGVFAGIIVLIFVIILGYAFTQVFLALPGGTWWAILFVVVIIMIAASVVIAIVRGEGVEL